MATTFTYDDVKRRLSSGKYALSDADMKLAERNPDAGMSILNYKDDYTKATTDEARALANMNAENIRKTYGGYTGGVDGSNYYLSDPTPSSFNAGTAPSYSSNYSKDIQDRYDALKNYGSFEYNKEAPTFDDKYAGKRDELINAIANPEKFSYDPANDESYKAYSKQYAREGQRATADALAAASAQSGGIASSYAQTAAGQQANYYAAQLTDKIPQLYENAYNRYLNEYNMKREALNSIQSETNAAHDRYLGDYNIYNTDRNFAYQKYLDDYARLRNQLSDAQSLENQDYSRYRDSVSDYQNDRDFRYNQLLDTISQKQTEDATAYSRAKDQAGYRDYSGLEKYGFNMDGQRAQDKLSDEYTNLQLGSAYADLGDYGNVDRLGIDSTNLRQDRANSLEQIALENEIKRKQSQNYDKSWADDEYSRKLELAKLAAAQGDYTMLKSLGIDTSAAESAATTSEATSSASTEAQTITAYNAYKSGKATAEQLDLLIEAGLLNPNKVYAGIKSGGDGSSTTSDAAKLYKALSDYQAGKATEEQYDILIEAGYLNSDGSGAAKSEPDYSGVNKNSPAGGVANGLKVKDHAEKTYKEDLLKLFENGYVPIKQPSVSYAEAQNTILSRDDWNILKARGAKQPNIANYGSYDEYIADVNAYLNQYYGG